MSCVSSTAKRIPVSRARSRGLFRPELHRYCARLTGSVIDGEDIVQETLAKALYALSQSAEMPQRARRSATMAGSSGS